MDQSGEETRLHRCQPTLLFEHGHDLLVALRGLAARLEHRTGKVGLHIGFRIPRRLELLVLARTGHVVFLARERTKQKSWTPMPYEKIS